MGAEPADVLADVRSEIDLLFHSIAAVAGRAVGLIGAALDEGRHPSGATLAELDPLLLGAFGRHPGSAAGLGVVLAPGVIAGHPRWVHWFWEAPGRDPERLRVNLDPAAPDSYDYTTTEWYRRTQRTGRRSVTGPYVDYICTNEYVFTLASPMHDRGRFVGIAGADIRVSYVESLLLPRLQRLGGAAVVTNEDGRVIASNRSRVVTGTLLGTPGAGTAHGLSLRQVPTDVPDQLPWRVLLAPECPSTGQAC